MTCIDQTAACSPFSCVCFHARCRYAGTLSNKHIPNNAGELGREGEPYVPGRVGGLLEGHKVGGCEGGHKVGVQQRSCEDNAQLSVHVHARAWMRSVRAQMGCVHLVCGVAAITQSAQDRRPSERA